MRGKEVFGKFHVYITIETCQGRLADLDLEVDLLSVVEY